MARMSYLQEENSMSPDKYRYLAFHCRICGVGLYNIPTASVEPLCRECAAWALKVLKVRR